MPENDLIYVRVVSMSAHFTVKAEFLRLDMFAIFPILQTKNFLQTEIICDFFILFESLKGKRKDCGKLFLRLRNLAKNAFKVTPQKFLLGSC